MNGWNYYLQLGEMLWPALLAAGAVSMSGGVTGVFVVLRRDSLLALALPQVVAVGVAIGLNRGWPVIYPAIVVVVLTLTLVMWLRLKGQANAILPALYVAGLSFSILLIAHSGAHLSQLQQLFAGIDVAVSGREAGVAAPILMAAAVLVMLFWRRWLLLAQAPGTAEIAGVSVWGWHAFFLALLATNVLVGTSTVGIALVVAMLFLPAAVVLPWARRIPWAMGSAAAVGMVCLAVGFVVSAEMDWPLSQSAAAVGCVFAGISQIARRVSGG